MEMWQLDERDWFRVDISNEASFIVKGFTADHARLKAIYYCHENPWLEIKPDEMFDHAIFCQSLDADEEAYYQILGDTANPVRYMGIPDWARQAPTEQPSKTWTEVPGQLALFLMNRFGSIRYLEDS